MNKAWLTCFLVCGVCLQGNASENNSHAEIKELLKPALVNNMASLSGHDSLMHSTVKSETANPVVVFTPLTSVQRSIISTKIFEILNSLDTASTEALKKKFKLQSPVIDVEQIVPVLQSLAQLSQSEALNMLGDMYKLGQGVQQDREQAFAYYQQAADLNNSEAMNSLGECYSYAIGCTADLEKAASWFQKAAELGNIEAQFNLGYVYEFGEGVPINIKLARYWYEQAAAHQHVDSLLFLGQMYLDGQGVPFNETLAKDYLGRACDLGSADGCSLYINVQNHSL